RGHQVVSYDLVPFDYPEKNQIKWIVGDIRNPLFLKESMAGSDIVIHAAAALPLYSPEDIRTTDVDGTRNVCQAALENQIKKVKSDVENLLPSLEAQRATFSASRFAEIYEGYNGLKSIRMELLESMRSGEELLVLGAPRVANEKMEGWLLDFHKVRLKKKVSMKIIYNENVHDFGSKRERMKLTQVHYMPNNISTPTWVDVFPNAVFIGIITSKPVAFVVRDKEAADSFRNYFNLLWGISVK
ncbi:MAG: polysaccharide biosynthesis protein, partial [archaeon]